VAVMGLFGPPAVTKMKSRRDVRGLVRALTSAEDCDYRSGAAEALGEIGDPLAIAPLLVRLQDSCSRLRTAAAEALGKIGEPRAVEPLTTVLRHDSSDVRRAAVEALGRIGDRCAVAAVIAAIDDQDANVRRAAVNALDDIGVTPAEADELLGFTPAEFPAATGDASTNGWWVLDWVPVSVNPPDPEMQVKLKDEQFRISECELVETGTLTTRKVCYMSDQLWNQGVEHDVPACLYRSPGKRTFLVHVGSHARREPEEGPETWSVHGPLKKSDAELYEFTLRESKRAKEMFEESSYVSWLECNVVEG